MNQEGQILPQNQVVGRSAILDQIKGIAILGVVFIHAAWLGGPSGIFGEVFVSLSRLAVPVFFLLFAYFVERSLLKNAQGEMRYLLARFLALIPPFLFWSALYFVLTADFQHLTMVGAITKHWSGFGWSGQYFFVILFQIVAVFFIIRRVPWMVGVFAVSLAVMVAVSAVVEFQVIKIPSFWDKLGDRAFIYWLPYVFAGILMARNRLRYTSKWFLWAILLIPVEAFLTKEDSFPYFRIGILLIAIFSVPISASLSSFNGRVGNFLTLCGRNSMAVFVLNPLIVLTLSKWLPLPGTHSEILGLFEALVIVVLTASLAILASLGISKIPYLRAVL